MSKFKEDFIADINAGVCTGLGFVLVFVIAALVGVWVWT